MVIALIKNIEGRRHINPLGVAILLSACLLACMVIPATGLWLVFHDANLLRTSLGTGFMFASIAFGSLLSQTLRSSAAKPQKVGDLND